MKIYFLLPYLAVSLIHLYCCFMGRKKGQGGTKPLLMPLLLFFYLMSSTSPDPLMTGGILLGFAGDVFLLFSRKKVLFLAGLFSFLLGHICYTVYLVERIQFPSLGALCFAGLIYLAIGIAAFWSLRKDLGEMLVPASLYLLVILGMAYIGCLFCLGSGWSLPGWMFLLGGSLFVLSDYILAKGSFATPLPRNDFLVMSTYLTAQLLLTLGALL